MTDSAVFTIVSCNYFHYARTLMRSIAEAGLDADLYVLLADCRFDPGAFRSDIFTTVSVEQSGIPEIRKMCFLYNILELNTAVKPFFIERLFEKGYRKIVYLDPDIYVYTSLDHIFRRLDYSDAVLTPHITQPLDDGYKPGDIEILRSGTYNLGFIGLKSGPQVSAFVKWWQTKLRFHCFVDFSKGMFVDQKWCEYIPSFVEPIFVDRSPGLNVAYWNLIHRHIEKRGGRYFVNGTPLIFFHFSGLNHKKPIVFSKHEDRFQKIGLPGVVKELVSKYIDAIYKNGSEVYRNIPYGYDYFSDGKTRIHQPHRDVYRASPAIQRILGDDPFDMSKDPGFSNTFNSKAFGDHSSVTSTALAIYRRRPDLQAAFPNIQSSDGENFAKWFVSSVPSEYGLDEIFLQPFLEYGQTGGAASPTGGSASPAKPPLRARLWRFVKAHGSGSVPVLPNNGSLGKRALYKVAIPAARVTAEVARRCLGPAAKARLRSWMLGPAPDADAFRPDDISPAQADLDGDGLNVVGYLHAELGVGESARSTIRAAQASGIKISAYDYRVGCPSRMLEALPDGVSNEEEYSINLCHVNADQSLIMYRSLGPSFFSGKYNIGYWYWELENLPEEWVDSFKVFNEIWTATRFCQEAVSRKSDIPVVRIPPSICPEVPESIGRESLGLPKKGFLFLTMADFFSFPERKNPLGAIEAYCRAFPRNTRGVYFVVKLSNSSHRPEAMEIIRKYMDKNSSIILIDAYLERPQINALLNSCDCYVSLHRSEAFGLPMAEAMYMGKPVIGTAWSGNTDFMNLSNSLPVSYKMKEIDVEIGPYGKGQVWADPDLDHAAEQMRRVYSDASLARSIGQAAAHEMRTNYSPQKIGNAMQERLHRIKRARPLPI